MRYRRANRSAASRLALATGCKVAIGAGPGRPAFAGVGVTEEELKKRLAVLRIEHRDLDAAIAALTDAGGPDQLQVARLKKRKLALRDQIFIFEDYLTPDIIA